MFSWACEGQNVLLFYSEQFSSPAGNTWMPKSPWIINWCGSPGTDVPERQRWAAAQKLGSDSMVGQKPLSPKGRKLWFLANAVLFPSPWEHNKWMNKYMYFTALRNDGYAHILPWHYRWSFNYHVTRQQTRALFFCFSMMDSEVSVGQDLSGPGGQNSPPAALAGSKNVWNEYGYSSIQYPVSVMSQLTHSGAAHVLWDRPPKRDVHMSSEPTLVSDFWKNLDPV